MRATCVKPAITARVATKFVLDKPKPSINGISIRPGPVAAPAKKPNSPPTQLNTKGEVFTAYDFANLLKGIDTSTTQPSMIAIMLGSSREYTTLPTITIGIAGIAMRRNASLWKSNLLIHDLETLPMNSITASTGMIEEIPTIGVRKIAGRRPPATPVTPVIHAVTKAMITIKTRSKSSNGKHTFQNNMGKLN